MGNRDPDLCFTTTWLWLRPDWSACGWFWATANSYSGTRLLPLWYECIYDLSPLSASNISFSGDPEGLLSLLNGWIGFGNSVVLLQKSGIKTSISKKTQELMEDWQNSTMSKDAFSFPILLSQDRELFSHDSWIKQTTSFFKITS